VRYSLMQPYLFPYVGYFSLIARADLWVVFDTAQYIKGGWINRNRCLKSGGGWDYFVAPVAKFGHNAAIREVRTVPDLAWVRRVRNQLMCFPKAPGFEAVRSILCEVLDPSEPSEPVARLAVRSLSVIARSLDMPFSPRILSSLRLDLPDRGAPGEWGWLVGQQLGASAYVNPPGGRDLFDPHQFRQVGMRVEILKNHLTPYQQASFEGFEPGLSILDLILWCGLRGARERVMEFTVEELI
jgi:hypothetical protein